MPTTNDVLIFEIRSLFELVWLPAHFRIVNSPSRILRLLKPPGFLMFVIDLGYVVSPWLAPMESFDFFDIFLGHGLNLNI